MSETLEPATEKNKPFTGNVSMWLGIVTSFITVLLTVYTAYNKTKLDDLENKFKAREATIDESKERVERYKWVFSLYKDLSDTDQRKSKFTSSLITLALSDTESKKLFAGFRSSSDRVLQNIGQSGLKTISNGHIVSLVSKIDTVSTADRTSAVTELENKYRASPDAITLVLNLYNPDNIKSMSANGIINGLYYLDRTDFKVWSQQQISQGNQVADRVESLHIGQKTQNEIVNFRKFLKSAVGGI